MLINGKTLADRYRIKRALRDDGAEAMYEATDLRRETPVCVIEISFEDEATRLAAERDARLLTNLRHPSLPFVIDYFPDGKRFYLVTEFVGAESLADRLSRTDGPPPVNDVLDWMWEMLDVLEYLHGQLPPILHGRISPSNIHVYDGQVFLLGLRSTPPGDGRQTAPAALVHTQSGAIGFASLEQIRGMAMTPASNIYSLGATLYALLTNVVPDDALQRAISESDPLESIEVHRPDIDAHVAQAVMAALALDSKKRPQSARDMRDLLFKEVNAAKPPRRYTRALAAAGVLASVVLLVATTWHFYPPPCDKIPPLVAQRVSLKCLAIAPTPAPAPAPAPPESQRARDEGEVARKGRSAETAAEAATLQQRGEYKGALGKADLALELDPKNAYAEAVRCDAIWDTEYEAAEYETASQFTRMPKVEECAKRILALVKEPSTAEDFAALAWAHTAQRNNSAAIANADKALSMKSDLVMAYMVRAVAVLGGKPSQDPRYQKGVADLREVLRMRPDYPQAHYLLSSVYVAHNLLPLAEAEADRAAQLHPQAKFFIRLGDISIRQGQVAKAAEHYNKALEKNPGFFPAYRKLAQLYYDHESFNDARGITDRGLQVRDDAPLRDLSGLIYLAADKPEKAVAEFSRAIELDPHNPNLYVHRADCYSALEDEARAVADADEALRLREKEKATQPLSQKTQRST